MMVINVSLKVVKINGCQVLNDWVNAVWGNRL